MNLHIASSEFEDVPMTYSKEVGIGFQAINQTLG